MICTGVRMFRKILDVAKPVITLVFFSSVVLTRKRLKEE
jgi:hypothetical protein